MTCALVYSGNMEALNGEDLMTFAAKSCRSVLQCSQRSLKNASLPDLTHFIKEVTEKANVSLTTMVIGLIYIHRLKKTLPATARGDFDTPHKIFLSTILVASKFVSDESLQNKTISDITDSLYSVKDVNTMERSFLGLLNYDLYVSADEVETFVEENKHELNLAADWKMAREA